MIANDNAKQNFIQLITIAIFPLKTVCDFDIWSSFISRIKKHEKPNSKLRSFIC